VAAWIDSLRAVAEADGPRVICYNFMPVLDWTRTELRHPVEGGGTAMRFDLTDFAAFDLHLLLRDGAEADYPDDLREMAASAPPHSTPSRPRRWPRNITAGPARGRRKAGRWTMCAPASPITRDGSRRPARNLIAFLKEVVPVAEELGLRLCCHPDDPPFPLLGLPRVMSTLDDYETVLEAVPSPANGATFCTGSLGVRADFDPVAFVRRIGPRIHFVHLRNTTRMRTRTACASVSRKARIWRAIPTWSRRSARSWRKRRRVGRRAPRRRNPDAARSRP
jgi:mannonate dehydratase